MIAPATIIITMHEVRMDSFRHWSSLCQVSSRFSKAITSVPAAPMAAPSVAVKKPANMPPITSTNSDERFPNALERGELLAPREGRPRRAELRVALALDVRSRRRTAARSSGPAPRRR